MPEAADILARLDGILAELLEHQPRRLKPLRPDLAKPTREHVDHTRDLLLFDAARVRPALKIFYKPLLDRGPRNPNRRVRGQRQLVVVSTLRAAPTNGSPAMIGASRARPAYRRRREPSAVWPSS